jgi:signal transduction histidine kinase
MAEELQHLTLELQAKNADMERFLYTASHDLKSPVVTVRTFLGYLEKDLASADAGRIEKDMNFMRVAADKMAQLLDEMVDFARIGHTVVPPERVELKNLIEEVLGIVAGRITERGVTVTLGDLDVTLHGDRSRLAELWQNLLDNAVKFMGNQSEPCVEMGVERRTGEVVFYVRDNGIGIDPRYHAKVFGLFEKLDPKAEGTGLGLALVRRIVELYQGRIWPESAGLAQGTCFYFTLPGALINPTGEKT